MRAIVYVLFHLAEAAAIFGLLFLTGRAITTRWLPPSRPICGVVEVALGAVVAGWGGSSAWRHTDCCARSGLDPGRRRVRSGFGLGGSSQVRGCGDAGSPIAVMSGLAFARSGRGPCSPATAWHPHALPALDGTMRISPDPSRIWLRHRAYARIPSSQSTWRQLRARFTASDCSSTPLWRSYPFYLGPASLQHGSYASSRGLQSPAVSSSVPGHQTVSFEFTTANSTLGSPSFLMAFVLLESASKELSGTSFSSPPLLWDS